MVVYEENAGEQRKKIVCAAVINDYAVTQKLLHPDTSVFAAKLLILDQINQYRILTDSVSSLNVIDKMFTSLYRQWSQRQAE